MKLFTNTRREWALIGAISGIASVFLAYVLGAWLGLVF